MVDKLGKARGLLSPAQHASHVAVHHAHTLCVQDATFLAQCIMHHATLLGLCDVRKAPCKQSVDAVQHATWTL